MSRENLKIHYFSNPKWQVFLWLFLSTCLLYIVPLLNLFTTPRADWDYFNGLSLFVSSSIHHYRGFPIHDPWMCGGLDYLTNIQNRVFSPLGLLDLIFRPFHANLASLMLCSGIGLFGAYLCGRRLNFGVFTSALFGYIFISSSWFGLHFAEGHIRFGSIQLLPLLLFLTFDFERKKNILAIIIIESLIALDGGFYALIFSIYLILTAIIIGLGGLSFSRVRRFLSARPGFVFISLLTFVLLSSPKLLPVFFAKQNVYIPFSGNSMTLRDILTSFFNPFQHADSPFTGIYEYRFHEFGNYLGILTISLFILSVVRFRRDTIGIVGAVLFWLWAGLGWGGIFNPWTLHEFSLFSVAHVQSRVFIIADIFILLLGARFLNVLEKDHRRTFILTATCLVLEMTFVRNYPYYKSLLLKQSPAKADTIRNWTVLKTLYRANVPEHYLLDNAGSRNCPEPSFSQRKALVAGTANYFGEVHILGNAASEQATLISYNPGEIHFRLSPTLAYPVDVEFNTNELYGWRSSSDRATVIPDTGMLRVRVEGAADEYVINYRPSYFSWIFILWGAGFLGLALLSKMNIHPISEK